MTSHLGTQRQPLAVLLAAGTGSRLGGRVKALFPLEGRPLVDHCIETLLEAGFGRLLVVTGHAAGSLEAHLRSAQSSMAIECLHNPRYLELNNFYTLRVACAAAQGPLLILNSDVVFRREVVERVCEAGGPLALAIEPGRVDPEALKAEVAGDRVRALGKHLDAAAAFGEFIGISLISDDIRRRYLAAADHALWRDDALLRRHLRPPLLERGCTPRGGQPRELGRSRLPVRRAARGTGGGEQGPRSGGRLVSGVAGQSRFPSVSVVIPTHDRLELLTRAVESVLRQDYPGHIECLVVFDKTTPVPLPVEVGPKRSLRTLSNRRTPGLAGARNAGALAAGGELLGFLDDDDEWLPRKLSRQVELMQSEGAPLVACGVYVCRGGRRFHRVPAPSLTFTDFLRSRHMEVSPITVLVERARFITDIGLVDERIPGSYGEDYEWMLRATRAHDVLVVQEPLVRINWHGASYFARDWETIAAAQRYLLRKYPDFAGEPVGLARIAGQISLALAAAGNRAGARRWARKTLRLSPGQPRGYLALLVSAGAVRPEQLLRLANAFGRGL